jgi:hypothetical protein
MKLPRLIKVPAAIGASLGFGLHPLWAPSPMEVSEVLCLGPVYYSSFGFGFGKAR